MGIFNGIPDGQAFVDKVIEGFLSDKNLKDYSHASKLFRNDNLALTPNLKFLFHVYFQLNFPNPNTQDPGLVGALVKSVQLPSYRLDTDEYIQYNRKRLVHKRVNYEPITIRFHDDSSDVIRSLWYDYYSYYFADSSYEYQSGQTPTGYGLTDYNSRDQYNPDRIRQSAGWGLTSRNPLASNIKPAFFKDITIYGMSRGNFKSYTLINPVITSWQQDTYDYDQGNGTMEHTVTIQYEAFKYGEGKINKGDDILVNGFAKESRYDTEPGALGRDGRGAIDLNNEPIAGLGKVSKDLASGNYISALRTLAKGKDVFNGNNLANAVKADLTLRAATAIKQSKFEFPSESELFGRASKPSSDKPIGE